MKLIKKLGKQLTTEIPKTRRHFGLYECPQCKHQYRILCRSVDKRINPNCRSCINKNTQTKHGGKGTRLYSIWKGMKNRCNNKNNPSYKNYGDRGISVNDKWQIDFKVFREWSLGNGYLDTLTIDRINNDGNYEPLNCRWVNRLIQARNTRILRSDNKSGYRGVSILSNKKYVAEIQVNMKRKYIGRFDTPIEAAKAYDKYVTDNNLEHTKNF